MKVREGGLGLGLDNAKEQTELLDSRNLHHDCDGDDGGGRGMYLQTHQTVHLEWVILVNETHIPIRLTENQ